MIWYYVCKSVLRTVLILAWLCLAWLADHPRALAQGPNALPGDIKGFQTGGFPGTPTSIPRTISAGVIPPTELLVKFRPDVSRQKKQAAFNALASEVKYFPGRISGKSVALSQPNAPAATTTLEQLALVRLNLRIDAPSAIRRLERNPDVLYAEPNYRFHIAEASRNPVVPDDFDLPRQWSFHNTGQTGGQSGADIDAPHAWQLSTGDKRVVAAVIDTGVDYYHPDLAANIWLNTGEIAGNGIDDDNNGYIDDERGYDFVSQDSDPMDDHSHGTHVAGIIGASGNNKIGVTGVCWKIRLMAVKAFDENGDGDLAGIIAAIHYAVNNGAQIINGSWGGPERSRALEDAIAEANNAGVLFVAAAGNEKNATPLYPAAYSSVLAVAATDHNDQRAAFSSFGAFVDVAAPGDTIYSTVPNNRYDYLSGTSMAAPLVSGLAALILARHPEFSHREIENIIRNTADPITTDKYIGSGRINAYRALQVNAPLPVAKLNLPDALKGVLPIQGAAQGENFAGYTLIYGKGDHPTDWTELYSSNVPVADGILLDRLSTAQMEEGTYTIQLIARNADGQSAIDRVVVNVHNVSFSFPMNNDVLRAGETIPIRGTIFGPNRTYTVQYGVGLHPAVWLDQGINLMAGGTEQILNGTLATWDTRTIRANEFYSLKLTAKVAGNVVAEDVVHLIYLDGHLKPGWPQYLPTVGEFPAEDWRDVKVGDLDHDGFDELILVDHGNSDGNPARLLVYRQDGQLLWSKELAGGAPYSDVPVIGDVDNDGFMEIFVDVGAEGELFAFRYNGTPLAGNWPVRLETKQWGKVLADLDGDGTKELIAYAQTPVQRSDQAWRQLLVLDRRGQIIRKWELPACETTGEAPRMFPAVGNLDGDPDLEIVAVSGCNQISAFKLTKTDGPLWTATVSGALLGSPVLGDLDHDGTNEIVMGAALDANFSQGGVHVFNHQGRPWPNWPALGNESFEAAPALADFDGDGYLEICIPSWKSQKVHLLRQNGFEAAGWPVGSSDTFFIKSSPVIGDVDGDGRADVVLPAPGYWFLASLDGNVSNVGGVRAWNFQGQPINLNRNAANPALIMESSAGDAWLKGAPITLADIDHNGKLDIIAASIQDRAHAPIGQPSARKNRSSLYVWELDVPYSAETLPWPTFQANVQHTGCYSPPAHANRPPLVLPIPDQIVRVGQSFYPIALDRYVEDPDNRPSEISWSVASQSQFQIVLNPNRVATVIPPRSTWTGIETIRFIAVDPLGERGERSATFEIRGSYDPPHANADTFATPEDTPVEMNLLANDTDPSGAPPTVAQVSKPGSGTLKALAGGRFLYTPRADFSGTDSFDYTLANGQGGLAIGSVTVTVTPVNDSPMAAADLAMTWEDTPCRIDVLANDKDPDGDSISIVEFTRSENGSVTLHPQGGLLYSPKTNFFGLDTFSYRIRDSKNAEATNSVSVMVRPVNDPPVAADQSWSLNKHASINLEFIAHDAEEDPLLFKVVKGPEHGVLLSYPNVATYSPAKDFVGTDSFTYVARDGQTEGNAATVTLTILDANNPPVAQDQSITTEQGQAVEITLTALDADNEPSSFRVLSQPTNGTLSGGDGPKLLYQPQANYLGPDEFSFQASDGQSSSATATVRLQMTDQNTAPVAQDSGVELKMNTSANFVLQAQDGESNPLTFQILTNPINGVLTGVAPKFLYTPNTNFAGSDRLSFQVNDGEFDSGVGTVIIVVKYPNTAPVVKEQSITGSRNTPIPLVLDVDDADGDTLNTAILKGPKNGRLMGRGKSFTYIPNVDFTGTDGFTYKVWDGHAYSQQAKVSLTITPFVWDPALRFAALERSTDGRAHLLLKTQPGQKYTIQASSNLIDWVELLSETAAGETISVTDTNAPALPRRYYRAVRF